MRRSELREHIFRIVFELEFYVDDSMEEQTNLYLDELSQAEENDLCYIRGKAAKIAKKTPQIDELLNEHTTGWKTGRMNKVDLSILRLAVYEMNWDNDVPTGVAIDEAVELAKKYGGADSPAFINGVLAKLTK